MLPTTLKSDGMKYLLHAILILLPYVLYPQYFSRTEIHEDLSYLSNQILKYQPTIPLYTENFEQKADSLMEQLADSLDRFQYFQEMSRLIVLAGEGHYAVGDWEDTIHSGFLTNQYHYLPIGVYVIGSDRLFVRYDVTANPRLSKGDEILSINGVTAPDLIRQLSALIPTDGAIKTYPLRKLEAGFNWMYYLGIDQPEEFRLEIRRNNLRMTVDVAAITRAQMQQNAASQRQQKPAEATDHEDPLSHFAEFTIDDSLAILKLKGFSRSLIEELDLKAPKFYKGIFQQLAERQVETLVIDLRGNNGGRLEFESELLPYIMKNSNSKYYRQSISWEGKQRNKKLPKPSKLLFRGQIYVFIDGLSFSAGSSLARHLKEYGNAIIIGEESGSRYEGFAAGSKQYVVLPNSGVSIGIPRYSILYPDNKKQNTENRGVLPDVEIRRSMESIVDGTDPWQEALKKLMNH